MRIPQISVRLVVSILVVLILLAIAATSFFSVDQTEQAVVQMLLEILQAAL